MKKDLVPHLFFGLALLSLIGAVLVGLIGGIQYLIPGFLKESFAFYKIRPMHVTFAVSWIVMGIFGGVYYYLPRVCKSSVHSTKLARAHAILFLLTGLAILASLFLGVFGGREYMAFSPYFSIPVLLGWCLFGFNYFKTLYRKLEKWPVYLWMWATGIVFMLFTLTEAHLWLFPFFRDNLGRDLTVQWKSYGAMVGSWNMLIYGTAIYLMHKITKDHDMAFGSKSFSLYFLGFAALLFGWGHHTYIIPVSPWIRTVAYIISMGELVILGNIIWNWRKTVDASMQFADLLPARFLFLSELWVFLNLVMALLLSVPALNLYTHGTHITVAHAMGTTIGINTTILLASLFYVLSQKYSGLLNKHRRLLNRGIRTFNWSLIAFCTFLLISGFIRGEWLMTEMPISFREMSTSLRPYLIGFVISGVALAGSVLAIAWPALKCLNCFFRDHTHEETTLSPEDTLCID